MKVKCVSCATKFDVYPENFSNHEIIYCPVCGLDHEVIKKSSHVVVESVEFA